MTIAYVKKNTEGGAAGLVWESGEVKALDSRFADELVRLAPGDYEQVSEDEFTPEIVTAIESPIKEPLTDTEATEESTEEIVAEETSVATPPTPRKQYKKKSETPSAE